MTWRPAPVRNLGNPRIIAGKTALAKVLRTTPSTLTEWTRLPVDPLRLLRHPSRRDNMPIQYRERLDAWRLRTWGSEEEKAALATVRGWAEIAAMVDIGEPDAREMAVLPHDPLPVQPKRRFNKATGKYEVWAYADAIRDWLTARMVPWELRGGPTTREDVCPPMPSRRKKAA